MRQSAATRARADRLSIEKSAADSGCNGCDGSRRNLARRKLDLERPDAFHGRGEPAALAAQAVDRAEDRFAGEAVGGD